MKIRDDDNYVCHQHMNADSTAIKAWHELDNRLHPGSYTWIPTSEVGMVIKKVQYESLPFDRVRVLFSSGIGWLDSRELEEVQIQSQSLL